MDDGARSVEGAPGDCHGRTRAHRRRRNDRGEGLYLTTRSADPARLGEIIRRHWAIENELHWVLDMTFGEDHSRVRDRNSTMNLALLRRLALSLLKREQSDPRKSIAMKRRQAGWDNDTLFTVLAAAVPNPS
jgi:predicted transposase YbfD/YdcC